METYTEKNKLNHWKKARRRIFTKRKWNTKPGIIDKLYRAVPGVFAGII